MRLVPAIAQQPQVERVRLVVPAHSNAFHLLKSYQNSKLEIMALKQASLQLLMQSPMQQEERSFLKNHLTSAFWRRILPPYLGWIEAKQLWEHSRSFDVVYAFWPHGRPFDRAQRPVVCTYQDTTFLDFPEILGGQATLQERRNAESWLYNVAHVIVSSQAVKNRLTYHFGPQFSAATVIYHNILPEQDITPELLTRIPERLPERYVVYPGNINPHKNHDTLLAAWSRFERRKEYPLVLIGEGTQVLSANWDLRHNTYWQQDRLIGLVTRLGLKRDEDFYALGYVSDDSVTVLLRRAYALIMPSLSEGGGSYPVEEALAYGIPVLCSDIPVMREHLSVHSAKIAWFDPLSTNSITEALNHLLKHYETYKQSAISAMADPRPTWDDIGAQYVAVFAQLAS